MSGISLGDLSSSFRLQRQIGQIKTLVQRGTEELSSGRLSNPSEALGGDFRTYAGFEHSRRLSEALRPVISEAATHAEAIQGSLGTVQEAVEGMGQTFLATASLGNLQNIAVQGDTAVAEFERAISALNQQAAGRSLFAGATTDQPALAPAATILAAVNAAVVGQTTAAGVIAAVDAWFDTPGGGYDTTAYLGSANRLAPMPLGDGATASLDRTAADPEIRAAVKSLALGALLGGPALSGDLAERSALALAAGERSIASSDGLTTLRGRIGRQEEAILAARTRVETDIAAKERAIADLVGADPFAVAARLESNQTQLETLYALTARLQRLSLADYLS